jgi:hypothetical protein
VVPIVSQCFPFLHGDETGGGSTWRCHFECTLGEAPRGR